MTGERRTWGGHKDIEGHSQNVRTRGFFQSVFMTWPRMSFNVLMSLLCPLLFSVQFGRFAVFQQLTDFS